MTATPEAKEPLTERGRRTRDALVAAARSVFEERGFPATTMNDIASTAGVSHGTVYTWFPTKEDVFRAVCDGVISDLYAGLAVPDDLEPVARVREANRRYLAAYAAHARLVAVAEQLATTDGEVAQRLADLRSTHVDRVAKTIVRWQGDGIARDDVAAHSAAAALCSMVEGFARHWLGRGEPHDEDVAVDTLTLLWARSLGLETTRGDR